MTTRFYLIIIVALLLALALLFFPGSLSAPLDCSGTEDDRVAAQLRQQLTEGFQTSARYLNRVAALDACLDPGNPRKQQIHTLIKDIEIKSSSYAYTNKIFFVLSLVFAVCIIGFPIISAAVASDSRVARIFSPTQLPAITLLAGLCFNFYLDYKGKQTSAENLIRFVYTAPASLSIEDISRQVRAGFAEIDDGHDFSELISPD